MLLEARGDPELSGNSNSVAVSWTVDFPRQTLTSDPSLHWEDGGSGYGFPRVLSTSVGAVPASGAQAATALLMGGQEQTAGGDSCHALALG